MRPALRLAAVALVLAAACGPQDGDLDTPGEVRATLEDFDVQLQPGTVAAGIVSFDVVNAGPSVHEFVLLRTDQPADALPTDAQGTVEEDSPELEVVQEVEDIPANQTEAVEVELSAGSYVVICNIPAHYGLGMHAALIVE